MSSGYERLGGADADEEYSAFNATPNSSSQNRGNPLSFVKPPTYYGEGPFDAPSSPSDSEDERASFLEKSPAVPPSPGLAELAMGGSGLRLGNEDPEKKHVSLRFLAVLLAGFLGFAACIGIIAATTYYERPIVQAGHKKFTLDHVFNGTFSVKTKTVDWVPEAGDGVFSLLEDDAIKLVDLKTNTTKVLVSRWDIKDEHGSFLQWANWKLSPDMKYILLKANYRKQWRWSSFGNYYVHDIAAKRTQPMIPPTNPATTAFATWAPIGQSIAYVNNNDLYVLPSPSSSAPIRVTTSGNASLFHGVPDWVYEEEIFSADFALWWSPDAHKLAFLRFDETEVDEYNFPIYNPTEDNDAVVPYTSDIVMKYPKPGYNNPLVSVHVFDLASHLESSPHKTGTFDGDGTEKQDFPDEENTYELEWPDRHPSNDSIILEVAWVGNASLVLKEVDRNADSGNVVLFDLDAANKKARATGKVVRKLGEKGEEGDEGWIDNEQNITPIPHQDAYLDVVPTKEGYNHIALFSPASSGTPHFLTSGNWEVTGGIRSIDAKSGLVYFQAAKPSSIERNIYSVPLPKGVDFKAEEPKPLTDDTKPSFYSASFSPQSGYYWLNYQGPSIPWQKIVEVGNDTFNYILEENEALKNATMEYEAPTIVRSTITSDGYELNTQEFRPPHMDDSGRVKYPVLFRVYGGPASQIIDLRFARNWHDWLACSLSYIVVNVDGRGTGFKGRHLRNPVKGNLGFYETIDQINAARIWAAKGYVDRKRIGIWGWSYGGFMSSKIVEANAGVHSLAIAVAPVTSWRLYDSIYTERYMNTPQLNPGGYVNASISNVTGFHNVDYLLAHGSGDDNVHFSNTAHLLDMFTKGKVRNFRFRMFTDSDHSISRRGALKELYEYMTAFLLEKWGKGGRNRGW